MTITPDTIVAGVAPADMTRDAFILTQHRAGSPAVAEASAAYDALLDIRVSIAFCLAVFYHESQYGKVGITPTFNTKNPGNCRSSRTGPRVTVVTPRGPFVKYSTWVDGWRDLAFRLVDPEYAYVKEGRRTIRQIITRFAPAEDNNVPESYIAAVVADMNRWTDGASPVGTPYDHIVPDMIDARSQLATATQNQGGVERGPYETIPLNKKRGVVIHYRGVVTDANAGLASYKADAVYHVGKNWVGAGQTPVLGSGIMYHIGIDGQGSVYLLRNPDRVLWHCGAWPQNEETFAIQLPLGGDQRATKAQLASLSRVVDALLAFSKTPRSEVWGHQQLSSTPCPGTLMADFIRPYRAGTKPTPPPPEPPLLLAGNPNGAFGYRAGFRAHVLRIGGVVFPSDPAKGTLAVFGWPTSAEYTGADKRTYQRTERATLIYTPGLPAPFDVVSALLAEAIPEPEAA